MHATMTPPPDPPASAIAAGAATALAVVLSEWPAGSVIAAALIGAVVSVWLAQTSDIVMTWPGARRALVQLIVSALAGVALSEIAVAVLPGYALTEPIARAPQWAIAGLVAAVAFRFGPRVAAWADRTIDSKRGGTPDA